MDIKFGKASQTFPYYYTPNENGEITEIQIDYDWYAYVEIRNVDTKEILVKAKGNLRDGITFKKPINVNAGDKLEIVAIV